MHNNEFWNIWNANVFITKFFADYSKEEMIKSNTAMSVQIQEIHQEKAAFGWKVVEIASK